MKNYRVINRVWSGNGSSHGISRTKVTIYAVTTRAEFVTEFRDYRRRRCPGSSVLHMIAWEPLPSAGRCVSVCVHCVSWPCDFFSVSPSIYSPFIFFFAVIMCTFDYSYFAFQVDSQRTPLLQKYIQRAPMTRSKNAHRS